jgi:hypothetical protein
MISRTSDDRNQTEHGRMLSSNMLLLNLILLIDVTFSTPTPGYNSKLSPSPLQGSKNSVFRNAQRALFLVLSLPAHQEPKACVPLQWAHYPLRSPSG